MVMLLVSGSSFLVLLLFQLATAAAPIAKPGCPDRCGNVSIAYPFGIREGCYLDRWFAIECIKTSNSSRAFIRSIQKEVLNVSVEKGNVIIKGPIISANCFGRESDLGMSLTGTPFVFSNWNTFSAVGCNTRAVLTETGPKLLGCYSTCRNDTAYVDGLYASDGKDVCAGKNCCYNYAATTPPLKVFKPSFRPVDESGTRGGCKLAFFADYDWFVKNTTDIEAVQDWEYVPMGLSWILDNQRWQYYDKSRMFCGYQMYGKDNSSNVTAAVDCSCDSDSGYEGNAYLGCQDIDECKTSNKSLCQGITKCVNKPGTYKCEVDKVWIMVIVIGAVIGVLLVLAGIWCLYKLIKKRRKKELKKKFFKRNGGLLLQQEVSSSDDGLKKIKIYSSKELEKATDCFNDNRILGQGGQGTVYKGMLSDGRTVAVKKSKIVDEEKLEEFINEVVVLSQISHRNVVRLLGCCLETEVPLLVYEFIPNGNLFQYLHNQNEDFVLSWPTRLQIAAEVAGALSYLHSAASIPIYHRDIKSTNILLDEKYRGKIADFGTSRSIAIDQTHLTTHVQGTFGYLDPEYFQSSQFTEKSDVYSFGVVLVELLSGEKPIFSATPTESRSLATHFILSMEDNKLFDILDTKVKENCCNEEVVAVANLVKRCLNLNGKHRPTMKEVATELERIQLSRKEPAAHQRSEETGNATPEVISEWVAAPTSSTCGFDNGETLSSSHAVPLITFKTW